MAKVRVHGFSLSLDGFAAGPDQDLENPLGVGGTRLHEWAFQTRTARATFGWDGGETGIDDDWWSRGTHGIGATIMGRNMFGPIRGPWPDETWKGWWGEDPPFHHSVFVLTHHARPSFEMQDGTSFHFVTDGIEEALRRAMDAADGKDVRIGGGAETIRQYLRAGLIDEMHVAIVPVLLGAGERLFEDLGDAASEYEVTEHVASPRVTHVLLERT